MNMLDEFSVLYAIQIVVMFAVVWFVLYKLIMLIRGTKAIQLLKGIVIVLGVRLASLFFNLQTLQWLTNQVIIWGFLAIIILFQPELRRALEQIGRGSIFSRGSRSEEDVMQQTAQSIVESCLYMAKRQIGRASCREKEEMREIDE